MITSHFTALGLSLEKSWSIETIEMVKNLWKVNTKLM